MYILSEYTWLFEWKILASIGLAKCSNFYKDYELGSYGIRECEFLKWIYATGCAEPRIRKIINLYKNGIP